MDYLLLFFVSLIHGPNQSEDFVIAKFLRAAPMVMILIYGDGSQTRTFCYVDDNINTCIKIFKKI